jgi:arginine-tRNA-protein transferase
MVYIQKPELGAPSQCQYLKDRDWRFEYFFATDLDEDELDDLLSRGWRKFGAYYFRPNCDTCRSCVPIRVAARDFLPSKSQRRIMKKCREIEVALKPLQFREEIFEIYRIHSMNRFGKESDRDEFIYSFFMQTCPSMQSEYYLEGRLMAVGFLDRSSHGLSSVYFIYDTEYESYSPGNFSVIKETELTAAMGLDYYYLGYYITQNQSMAYKFNFHPHEQYDWSGGTWNRESSRPEKMTK